MAYTKKSNANLDYIADPNHELFSIDDVPDCDITEHMCHVTVSKNYDNLSKIPQRFRTIKLYTHTVLSNPMAIKLIPSEIINDIINIDTAKLIIKKLTSQINDEKIDISYVCNMVIKICPDVIAYINTDMITEKMAISAVQSHGWTLKYIPQHLLTKKIYHIAVQNYPFAISLIPYEDRSIGLYKLAFQDSPFLLQSYVPIPIKQNPQFSIGLTDLLTTIHETTFMKLQKENLKLSNQDFDEYVCNSLITWLRGYTMNADTFNKIFDKNQKFIKLYTIDDVCITGKNTDPFKYNDATEYVSGGISFMRFKNIHNGLLYRYVTIPLDALVHFDAELNINYKPDKCMFKATSVFLSELITSKLKQ